MASPGGFIRYIFGTPMSQHTAIEWTDATWNPVTGCTRVSTGCDHCYALTLSRRLLADQYRSQQPVQDTADNRRDPFAVRLWPARLIDPALWRRRKMVFVNSMGDLFHEAVPDDFVLAVFRVMLSVDHHIYQVLTKRPGRMLRFVRKHPELTTQGVIPRHIWLGASVESQSTAYRIKQLRQVPTAIRFLSCEPLLGPLELDLSGIHWVIAGGESGIGHRPMNLAWARLIREACREQCVPFFFKQIGGRTPKVGGRLLDGRTWDEFPSAIGAP